MDQIFDTRVDVLVVGAGACGLAAAIAAHDAGAEVAILEKQDRPGGNTVLSTGSVIGAGTRFQTAAGIDDSPERLVADLEQLAGTHDASEVMHKLAEVSASLVEWLVDSVGVHLRLISAYRHIGHSLPRLHAPRSRRGQDLFDDLQRAAEHRGIAIALGNPVVELLQDDTHQVVGATVQGTGVERYRIGARKIILACNGFAANPELLREHCPGAATAQYFGALGSTGEAVLWARELGAGLGNLASYQGYAAVAYPHGSILSWTTIENGGITVDGGGRRFGDESEGYSGFASRVVGQSKPVHAVFDQRIYEIALLEDEFRELVEIGGVKQAATHDQLAQMNEAPPGQIAKTVEDYGAAAIGAVRDAFGRRDFGIAPLEPPFFYCQIVAGLFHTQGGLQTDADGRVLDQSGRSIPNLFAGGGAAAGISGRSGAAGYASGNGLLTALGLGWLAGKAAAAEIVAEPG